MNLYGWIVVAAVCLVLLAVVSVRAIRATRLGRRFVGLSVHQKLETGRTLAADPGLSGARRLSAILLLACVAIAFAPLPLPFRWLDRLAFAAVGVAALFLLGRTVPRLRLDAALSAAERQPGPG